MSAPTSQEANIFARHLMNRAASSVLSIRFDWDKASQDFKVVFTGASSGEASMWLKSSTLERIEAHWAAYCAANGVSVRAAKTFPVGSDAAFPSKSSPTGWRGGVVVESTATRIRVQYKFNSGKVSEKWVRKVECR